MTRPRSPTNIATASEPLDATLLRSVPDAPALDARLVVVDGPCVGQRTALEGVDVVIGRSAYADLRLSDASVSQHHAKVVVDVRDGAVHHRIIDLRSTNGTFVGGQRARDRLLQPGDRITVGRVELVYDCGLRAVPEVATALTRIPALHPVLRSQQPAVRIGAPLADDDDPWLKLIAALRFLRRYAWGLGLGLLLGGGAGVATSAWLPPDVAARFELSLMGQAQDNPLETQPRENLQFFRAPRDNFLRPAVIADALAQLGDDEVTDAEVAAVKGRLTLDSRGPYLWEGSYRGATGEEAEAYLVAHVHHFLEREIELPLRALAVEVETLRAELADADATMRGLELAKAQWASEAGGVVPEHAALLQARMFELQQELSAAQAATTIAAADLKLAKKLLDGEDPERAVAMADAQPYAAKIATLKRELAEQRAAGRGPMHPDVANREAELAQLQALHRDALEHGTSRMVRAKNPAYAALRTRYEEAKAARANAQTNEARLHRDLTSAQAAVALLPARDAEYAELTRDLTIVRERHASVSIKLQASEMRLQLERREAHARYDMLSPPTAEPVTIAKTMVVRGGLGAIAGLMLMFCVGLLCEMRRAIAIRVGPGGL